MLYNNQKFGNGDSKLLTESAYNERFLGSSVPAPPLQFIRITETGAFRDINTGEIRVVEV